MTGGSASSAGPGNPKFEQDTEALIASSRTELGKPARRARQEGSAPTRTGAKITAIGKKALARATAKAPKRS
jgi:hypothetical protein